MATPMNNLNAEQRAMAQKIIEYGKSIGASERVINAAVIIANAESDFKWNEKCKTSAAYGLFQYKPDRWDRIWKIYAKAHPDDPQASKSHSDVRYDQEAMIKVMYTELTMRESGYDQGIIYKNYKPGKNLYHVTQTLMKNGIDINTNFLYYVYLVHNTRPSEIINVVNGVFTESNLNATKALVDSYLESSQTPPSGGATRFFETNNGYTIFQNTTSGFSFFDSLGNTVSDPFGLADVENDFKVTFPSSGGIFASFGNAWSELTDWITDELLFPSSAYAYDVPSYPTISPYYPIGAFYKSVDPVNDTAGSVAASTPVLLGSNNLGLMEAQLVAKDANIDGQLTGAELSGIFVWRDLDENGLLDVAERVAPSAANISSISSRDYKFYTQGNGSPGGSVAATPTITVATPTTPASNYRSLRDTRNVHGIDYSRFYFWSPHEVKQTSDDTTMVGTDGNDEFDSNSYFSVYWLPSAKLVNFMSGGGDDVVDGKDITSEINGDIDNVGAMIIH